MPDNQDEHGEDFFADSELSRHEDAPQVDLPPEKSRTGSFYDGSRGDWWWDGKLDPCPVRPKGNNNGLFFFLTPQGELRSFTSRALASDNGLSELFCANLWWLIRHFPSRDREGNLTKRPHVKLAADAMMRACFDKGIFSDSVELRLAGTWRGPDGRPVVHAGDVLVHDGHLLPISADLGSPLYCIAPKCERPALETLEGGRTRYAPAPIAAGNALVSVLLSWNYEHHRSAELVAGYIAAAMLGDATAWRSHIFLRARPGAGKSTMLRCLEAALGGAAHPVQSDYTRGFITQRLRGQARAILLDEVESDSDQNRMRAVTELVRLLSDQGGARGGRGSPAGTARDINIRGAVCMAATVKGQWKQADRSRITVIELERFEREGNAAATPEEIEAMIAAVRKSSASLRARMLDRFDLFQENVRRARRRIIELGGTVRDGNQLGHLIAGFWTLTSDMEADDAMLDDVASYSRWITTLSDLEEGTDTATECWNYLLGARAHNWRANDSLTVGQVIARARDDRNNQNKEYRRALLGMGLRLVQLDGEPWNQASLAVANKHPGLEEIFRCTDYAGSRWSEILRDLEFLNVAGDQRMKVTPLGPMQFGGPKSRSLVVPAAVLPSVEDERP